MGEKAEIYSVGINGQGHRRLTYNDMREELIVWSPDGSQIAYLGREVSGGSLQAYIMNADGSGTRPLLDDPGVTYGNLAWSPDGRRMALVSWEDPLASTIVILDTASGRELLRIEDGLDHLWLEWSPDGTKLAYTAGWYDFQLYVVDVDTEKAVLLTHLNGVGGMDWSPTGEQLVLSVQEGEVWHIYVVDEDGANLAKLTDQVAYGLGGQWSPDGQKIAFICAETLEDTTVQICVMDVATREISRVTNNEFVELAVMWVEW